MALILVGCFARGIWLGVHFLLLRCRRVQLKMDIRDLVDEILELALHSDPVSADDYVQERAVHARVWDLIEQHDKELQAEWESSSEDVDVWDLENKIEGLNEHIYQLEGEIIELKRKEVAA